MGKHIIYVILKKCRSFRVLLRNLIRISLIILLISTIFLILIIYIPGLLESIKNLLTGLLEYIITSLIGLFDQIINSLINMITEAQIDLKIYKLIKVIYIFFISVGVVVIIFKAIDWAKSTFIAPLENGIEKFVYLSIIQIIPLFAERYFKNRDVEKLKKTQKNVEYETSKVYNIIRDYERRKTKFQKKYGGGNLTKQSEYERDLLLESISNQYKEKAKLEQEHRNLREQIITKKQNLNCINKQARDLIIDKKISWDKKNLENNENQK